MRPVTWPKPAPLLERSDGAGVSSECGQPGQDRGRRTYSAGPGEYTEVPWFWSEQYDCRFQMAGLPRAGDELVIRESGPNSMSVLSLGESRLHAIQCINAPRDYMAARKLIGAGDEVALDQRGNSATGSG